MEIRLDYATFNFDAGTVSPEGISKALCGQDSLCFRSRGLSENALMVSPFGLSYLSNSGFASRPHRLQVSGVGCEKFGPTLPNLVALCQSNGGELSFSRLDFAFDVLISDEDWKTFIVKAFSSSINSDRQRKKYNVAGSGLGMTIYIGSRLSDYYFRIYNKTLENPTYVYTENNLPVPVPDGYSVIRYEIEMKRHVHHRGDSTVVFDPSQYFYDYYSAEDGLASHIKQLWLSFGDEVLLPPGFADARLELLSKNKNFASISRETALEIVQDKLNSEPRSFDDTLRYVVSHFGKYIPFIVADYYSYKECEIACKYYCGFVPVPVLDNFIDNELLDLDDEDFEAWEDPFEPVQLEITPYESEV